MIRTVPTGDLGLDVLLGGGWRLVRRLGDAESTTVVVRGGSGAGKTLVGVHVALELARALGGDVVVGCVEILPTEYVAQLQSARPSLPADRIAMLPTAATSADGPRVYVGLMLDLDPEQPDLNASLLTLRDATATAGGKPVVFVVDSLIEGYGIGSSAPRIAADDCMKFAAKHGVGLVLCEEIVSDAPSPWVFAADTVLQVGVESRERGRWLEVKKHRFGPSATGRHELELAHDDGIEVFPAPHAWRDVEPQDYLPLQTECDEGGTKLTWGSDTKPNEPSDPFHTELVLVSAVTTAADTIASRLSVADGAPARTCMTLGTLTLRDDGEYRELDQPAWIATHYGPHRALRRMVECFVRHLSHLPPKASSIVVVGDVGAVLSTTTGADWAETLQTFALFVAESCTRTALVLVDANSGDGGSARREVERLVDTRLIVRSVQPMQVQLATRSGHRVEELTW
jgi:hypothetical protein